MNQVHTRPPRWDKHRSTYFSLGIVIALTLTVLLINMSFTSAPLIFEEGEIEVESLALQPNTKWPTKKVKVPKASVQQKVKKASVFDIKEVEDDLEESILEEEDPIVDEPIVESTTKAPAPSLIIQEEEVIETVTIAERMPIFGDCIHNTETDKRSCSDQSLLNYIYNYLRYPPFARQNGIEGVVIVEFVVHADGKVDDVKILRGVGGGCDEAVLNVMKSLPAWAPGKQNGRPVNVIFRMPVKFQLEG
jgi:protein TonB